MQNPQTPYEDIIIPLDMSSLSVKAKHGTDPTMQLSPSMRRKVVNPMYTLDMNRAKTVNNIEEQQLSKKLKDLEKQQNKMRSDMLQMKASLLPEITVTSAWGDKNTNAGGLLTGDASSERTRKRSGSLPPLITSPETEKARLGGSSSETTSSTKSLIAPTPPAQPIHRSRSMNEFDRGRPRVRPKSAICPVSATSAEARRQSFQTSKSANSSVESLPSELSRNKAGSNPTIIGDSGSHEDVTTGKQRTKSTSALLPLRKAKSTSNLAKVRRATVDSAELPIKHDRNSIFRNSSYNPVLLNPTLPPSKGPSTSNSRRRSSQLRLNQLSLDSSESPTANSLPSLEAQFEQLKACRYLRVPSDESD
ncbi:uncharacterized protein [Asterias amurensis]|uniref:uncharacterized protein n=1 Tax=Asterias amurensis TaxID=7602 RepID=UPI003AB1B548